MLEKKPTFVSIKDIINISTSIPAKSVNTKESATTEKSKSKEVEQKNKKITTEKYPGDDITWLL